MITAVAETQGLLYRAAQQILARDKSDGKRACRWMHAHDELLQQMIEQAQNYCGLGDDEAQAAQLKAGRHE